MKVLQLAAEFRHNPETNDTFENKLPQPLNVVFTSPEPNEVQIKTEGSEDELVCTETVYELLKDGQTSNTECGPLNELEKYQY
jgi:hypothetical protein